MSALIEKLQRLRREAGVLRDAAPTRASATAAANAVSASAGMTAAARVSRAVDMAEERGGRVDSADAATAGTEVHADATARSLRDTVTNAARRASPTQASDAHGRSTFAATATAGSQAGSELARLRRLLDLRPARSLPARAAPAPEPLLAGDCIAPGLYAIERRYAAAATAPLLPPRWSDGEPVARERFLCFDTETTGLAGGSGTRAFMIGAADWQDGELRVRQLYLTAMAGEAAMLAAFAAWLRADTVLVSYNGRSYDAPLLVTRYRLQRMADPLRGLAHVDLLHPVRRVYRGRWENCRLATIERNVLRVVRDDDLPGSEAPAAWRSYLRAGKTTDLLRVLEHNRQDVATLARLLEHMDQNATPAAWLTSA